MDIIERAITCDLSESPESAGLILQIIAGTSEPLTISEVCGVFGVRASTIRSWALNGVLEPSSWSGELLFSPLDVWGLWLEDSEGEELEL